MIQKRYHGGVKGKYLVRVLRFAFRGFAIRTDVWYALISIAISALTGGDKPVADVTTHDIAWYFLLALAFYLTIRVIVAPYFVWKEDQTRIAELETEVERPERREEEAGLEHRIALRKELGDELATLITAAEFATVPQTFEMFYKDRISDLYRNRVRIRELITLLSYDVPLRVCAFNLHALCEKILKAASEGEDCNGMLERLWAQRKLTYRLIHRDDEVNDLMTMIEIENLIEEHGESFRSSERAEGDDTLDEVKRLAREIGHKMHLIGKQPNLGSANRRKTLNEKDRGKLPAR